jgi:acetylornithine deacetylase/succinyl-diaminopimelate desuccinylase-like protein
MTVPVAFINENRERFVKELVEYLAIPSVSTLPERKADVERAGEFVRKQLVGLGFAVQVFPTARHPIVYGEWTNAGAGAPTVLIYGHYDVQPPDPLGEWRHGPFEPTIEGDNVVARGSSDNKGQHFAHLKALEAWMKAEGKLPVNVKVLIEGEEEIGSPNLEPFVREHLALLKCDMVVISDTAQFAPGVPAICYGLRGLVYREVNVTGPSHDLHSGSYGGSLDNPATVLARILSRLHDKNGRVMIPGFYDDVLPLTPEERRGFAKLGHKDGEYREEIGVPKLAGEKGYTTLERLWARPTCEVNGVYGGFMGEGAKTVIPARAGAKVSMRLVPNQDPKKIVAAFDRFIRSVAPSTVKVELKTHSAGGPVLVPRAGPAVQACARAIEKGFGRAPVYIREGGSIPVVRTFGELMGVPVVLVGFGLPDDRLHSPNEKFSLADFQRGILTSAHILEEAAAATPEALRAPPAAAPKAAAAKRTAARPKARKPARAKRKKARR